MGIFSQRSTLNGLYVAAGLWLILLPACRPVPLSNQLPKPDPVQSAKLDAKTYPTTTPLPRLDLPTPIPEVHHTMTVPTPRRFQVQGTQIIDPDGKRFLVRGLVVPYGYYFGSQGSPNLDFDKYGWGQLNLDTSERDFAIVKAMGVNQVRVMVTYDDAANDKDREKLVQTVTQARNLGLVVEIAGGDSLEKTAHIPVGGAPSWLAWLAAQWKEDPYVWIQPVNEPNCDGENCYDWGFWQKEHQVYVDIIRKAGNTSPIVVNTVSWSWDLSKLADYPLHDPLNNIVYGAHRYANCSTSWTDGDAAAANDAWARLARQFPIIVDETGAYNGDANCDTTYHIEWNKGMMDFITDWVRNGGGNGATAFAWYWSDDNSLSGDWKLYENDPKHPYGLSDGVLNAWGQVYRDHYLQYFDTRTNLARNGIAYLWYLTSDAFSKENQVPASGLNDGDNGMEVALQATTGQAKYQAAGILWEKPHTVSTINFIHSQEGACYTSNLQLQFTSDGQTWKPSGWKLLQDYPCNSRAGGATFTFTGEPTFVKGVRIVGAVQSANRIPAHAVIKEVQVY